MRNYLIILLMFFSIFNCSPDKKTYYIYDTEYVFKKQEGTEMIFYSTSIPVYRYWGDSIISQISRKGYFLLHFKEHDKYLYPRDTVFSKPASFLNSIEYFDSEWLKKEENLNDFWPYSLSKYGGREDTVLIYLIHPIPGTDSIKLERVHRWYKPNREG